MEKRGNLELGANIVLADEGLVESAVLVRPSARILVVELKAIFILAARLRRVPIGESEWLRTRKGRGQQRSITPNVITSTIVNANRNLSLPLAPS